MHTERTYYQEKEGKYVVEVPGGEKWTYDGNGEWRSDKGETHKAPLSTVAPVGYEDKKEYTTSEGVTWKYGEGQWQSSKGEKYVPPVNHYYRYDENHKGYVGQEGKVNDGQENVKDPSGKTWSYDKSAKIWKSGDGVEYNPSTGTTQYGEGSAGSTTGAGQPNYGEYKGEKGQTNTYHYGGGSYVKDTSGAYVYIPGTAGNSVEGYNQNNYDSGKVTDSYGNTWSRGSDGAWNNQGGGTGAPPSTGSYNSPSSAGTPSGEYSGVYGGSYSGGSAPSSSGSYSGSYSGGTSSGSYSGGTTGSYSGGSAPSGGGATGAVVAEWNDQKITGSLIRGAEKFRLF